MKQIKNNFWLGGEGGGRGVRLNLYLPCWIIQMTFCQTKVSFKKWRAHFYHIAHMPIL